MALSSLIINQKVIAENVLEKILKDRIQLIQDSKGVLLTKNSQGFPNKIKVLLYLTGGKAWELLGEVEEWNATPKEIEKDLGIPGNSLRPVLKELNDDYCVNNQDGKYSIHSKGVLELEDLLNNQDLTTVAKPNQNTKSKTNKGQNINKTGGKKTISKSDILQEMIKEGFFEDFQSLNDIKEEMGRKAFPTKTTSLPSYLIPLVRDKTLMREKKEKEGAKVWCYKIKK